MEFTIAVALALVLQSANVEADEAARYEQLVQLTEAREAKAEESAETDEEEWYEEQAWYGWYDAQVYQEWDANEYEASSDGITADEFRFQGVVYEGATRYTWYSQSILPGGGLDELNTNGRHVEGGYVVDGDGYIAVASSDHEKGTVLDTPFGAAKVYDTGCASGTIDVYVGW